MDQGALTDRLRDTLSCFDGAEPLSTSEVADRLALGRRSTYDRLDRLAEAGLIETKKVGASARVWWLGDGQPMPARAGGAGGGDDRDGDDRDGNDGDGDDRDDDDRDGRPERAGGRRERDGHADGGGGAGGSAPDGSRYPWRVFERVSDAFFAVDRSWRVTFVNGAGREVLREAMGLPEGASVVGRRFRDEVPRGTAEPFFEHTTRAMTERVSVTFEERFDPIDTWFEVNAYPDSGGLSVYFRDVTERRRRERELERYEAVVESVEDAIYVVDDDDRFVTVNEGLCEITGYDREELIGTDARELVTEPGVVDRARDKAEALQSGEAGADGDLSIVVVRKDGTTVPCETRLVPFSEGDGGGRCGVVRDVTGRRERERTLERYETVVETVDDGIYAVDDESRFVMVNESFCDLSGYSRDELIGTQTSELEDQGITGRAERLAAELREGDGDAVTIDMEVVRNDGERIPCETRIAPYDVHGWSGRCGVIRDVTDRLRQERELIRQRERLAALNGLNEVVQDITDAVIDRSTREEIERVVCERIVDSESYRFAWVGDVDTHSDRLVPRASAGAEEYLESIEVTVDPGKDRGAGPAGRAYRTGEVQVDRNAPENPTLDAWSDAVAEHGIGSVAAIPIVHEGTIYGVLCLYSSNPDGFRGDERRVIARIGEVVGHAIAAVGRKRALLSDDVVELEFLVRDVFDEYDIDGCDEGRLSFDHMVPIEDGEYVTYGTVSEELVGALRQLEAAADGWRSVSVREADGDGDRRFELRQSEPPVLSIVASSGGSIDRTVIEDGDYRMRVHLSPSVDVRRVIDAVKEAYPTAETVRRRDVTHTENDVDRVRRALAEELTGRQRAAIEAAYHAGFFGWPRGATAEEVADSMEIAPSTFHQHLRKAERKVYDSLFAGSR